MFEAQKEWICPENFPDLKGYKYIAIDLETKDPELKSMGSGAVRGQGNIVGIAVAVDGWSAYYPIAHEGGGNIEKQKVLDWFKKVCATDSVKIFHNAMYDVCWLRAAGVKINGEIIDLASGSVSIDLPVPPVAVVAKYDSSKSINTFPFKFGRTNSPK